MGSLTQDVANTLGPHFVSLSCVQYLQENKRKCLVFSGFVIEVAGHWFYVTAGHILRDVQRATAAGSTFGIWRLGDQTAQGQFGENSVPFDFDESKWLVIEDTELGLDYAAVYLDWNYRQLLDKGGAKPISANAWGDQTSDYDYWVLMGIPSESVIYDGNRIQARVVLAPLKSAEQPHEAGAKAENHFMRSRIKG